MKKNSSVNKFPKLLEFLLERKLITEYDSQAFRTASNYGSYAVKGTVNYAEANTNYTPHKYNASNGRTCILHPATYRTEECRLFLDKTPQEKFDLLKNSRACFACLMVGHSSWNCHERRKCTENGCDKFHHPFLHEARASAINMYTTGNNHVMKGSCILQIMEIRVNSTNVNVLWAATLSLITFSSASRLGLKGNTVQLEMETLGRHLQETPSCRT
jgi:hypothetical protein